MGKCFASFAICVSSQGICVQGVFAIIAPGRVVPNLVAGAIAEAGAQQAGDMMQDFKTAHLLGVCPRAQFYAMLMGSAASVFVSVGAYALYTSAFQIPGPEFPAPTAEIWLDMAELVGSQIARQSWSHVQKGTTLTGQIRNALSHHYGLFSWCVCGTVSFERTEFIL